MTIWSDGVYVASDTSLKELSEFASKLGLAEHQRRINRWAIYYELRDAQQARRATVMGAHYAPSRNAVWAKWQSRPGAEARTAPPPER